MGQGARFCLLSLDTAPPADVECCLGWQGGLSSASLVGVFYRVIKFSDPSLVMKATIATTSLSREAGGLYFAVSRIATELCKQEVKMSVHGLRDRYSDEDLPAWQPVHCELHDRKGPQALGYSSTIGNGLSASDPDLVHTHGIWQWPSAAVHRWHRRFRKPYIVSPHGMLDPWALAHSAWKKRIVSALYESSHLRDAACIHALCQSEAESIRAFGLTNSICIIPNGVDLVDSRTLEKETNKSERKLLLFLGRLHPKKGLTNALRAFGAIRAQRAGPQRFEEWQFVIAGWDQGGHQAELKRLCDAIGLIYADIPAVEFLGASGTGRRQLTAVENPWDVTDASTHPKPRKVQPSVSVLFVGPVFGVQKDHILREADAFILPSFSEGLPMSVLEAWSYGLPVLMTNHCNLPEGFASHAAISIDVHTESITEGMLQLFRSPGAELRSIGMNGRSLVEREFTWPKVAAQMKEVYSWMIGGGTMPAVVEPAGMRRARRPGVGEPCFPRSSVF